MAKVWHPSGMHFLDTKLQNKYQAVLFSILIFYEIWIIWRQVEFVKSGWYYTLFFFYYWILYTVESIGIPSFTRVLHPIYDSYIVGISNTIAHITHYPIKKYKILNIKQTIGNPFCETQPPASIGCVALSSMFVRCCLSRIGNTSSHLHYIMFQTIQTIYFLWGYDPGNVSVSTYPLYSLLSWAQFTVV